MATASTTVPAKQRMVQVAIDLFAARGFDNVGVVEIADAAGVSQPNIHYHFGNKRGLWEAAMRKLARDLQNSAAMQDSVVQSLDPLSALKAACAILLKTSQQWPTLGRIMMAEGQAAGERLEWLMREVYAEEYYKFQELVERCIEQGLIKPHKPYQIVMLLHGAAVTHFNMAPLVRTVFGEDVRAPANAAAFQELFLDVMFAGLAVDPPAKAQQKKARQ